MVKLGMGSDWLDAQLKKGRIFKLAIFPVTSQDEFACALATWDNLEQLAAREYPEVADKIGKHFREIRDTPYEDIEQRAGYSLFGVNCKGREVDDRYISCARLQGL